VHPAAVMMALLGGGTLGGFFGLLLAVPIAAVLKIVVSHLWHTYVLGEPYDEANVDEATPGVGMVEDVV
jgi:predicted PurR-regulated permease PerM